MMEEREHVHVGVPSRLFCPACWCPGPMPSVFRCRIECPKAAPATTIAHRRTTSLRSSHRRLFQDRTLASHSANLPRSPALARRCTPRRRLAMCCQRDRTRSTAKSPGDRNHRHANHSGTSRSRLARDFQWRAVKDANNFLLHRVPPSPMQHRNVRGAQFPSYPPAHRLDDERASYTNKTAERTHTTGPSSGNTGCYAINNTCIGGADVADFQEFTGDGTWTKPSASTPIRSSISKYGAVADRAAAPDRAMAVEAGAEAPTS